MAEDLAQAVSLDRYIPLGCLTVGPEELEERGATLPPADSPDRREAETRWGGCAADALTAWTPSWQLDARLRQQLLLAKRLRGLARLCRQRWAWFSFRVVSVRECSECSEGSETVECVGCLGRGDAEVGVCRVYVLPDDELRRLVPRSDRRLRKDLQTLLQTDLDYSAAAWQGDVGKENKTVSLQDILRDVSSAESRREDGDSDHSLLHMFNTIPSPQPQPDLLRDDEAYQRVQDGLACSKIRGLKTRLYGYQSRSAAVMLQRELCPGRIVDPRLQVVAGGDQEGGGPWYYDDVTGDLLRQPRLYDGVAGGILAEEMGTGKTLICLALILATRAFPAAMPEVCRGGPGSGMRRRRIASLADMAAAVVTRESVPWKLYFERDSSEGASEQGNIAGEFRHCVDVIKRNPAQYQALDRLESWQRETFCRVPLGRGAKKREAERAEAARAEAAREEAARAEIDAAIVTGRPFMEKPWSCGVPPRPPTPKGVPSIFLSHCSLVIVPANLVRQWEQEIEKHTERGQLRVLVVADRQQEVPSVEQILEADVLLFSIPCFERLGQDRLVQRQGVFFQSPLGSVHFKRVIVDEGHRLGNSRIGGKSNLLLVLELLHVSARWIVTGTPSTGLFGVDLPEVEESASHGAGDADSGGSARSPPNRDLSSSHQERKDLERIGAMASLYLKMRPWANSALESGGGGDTLADWAVYVMQRRHSSRSSGREDCLRATLDTLIVRHRKSEIGGLLPPVTERIVMLDGSPQDRLCLNLFSMMIIFNAVQSQRTDQDYFFHPSQRKALLQLVSNIRQSTFFGGYFYSTAEIAKAVETAQTFLDKNAVSRKVAVSEADERALRGALAFGRRALKNRLKRVVDNFHEVPIAVRHFPGGRRLARAWSIDLDGGDGGDGGGSDGSDGGDEDNEVTCTAAPLMRSLQQFLRPCLDAPHSLQAMFRDGRFAEKGRQVRLSMLLPSHGNSSSRPQASVGEPAVSEMPPPLQSPSKKPLPVLAGNTGLGDDSSPLKTRGSLGSLSSLAADDKTGKAGRMGRAGRMGKPKSHRADGADKVETDVDTFGGTAAEDGDTPELAAVLARAQIVSTASAKLSYLLDEIVRHQAAEQMIVFYDNENIAFYLAEHLELLQIRHLIYARGITAARRAQYVDTFNHNARFRVLLMDLSQAAFGLDMRSASRVYFVSPVLNPQVEAQAIGRVRRISNLQSQKGEKGQTQVLTVETLVLRDSLEELLVERRRTLTQAEHRTMKTILDDRAIYEWILNARIRGEREEEREGEGGGEKGGEIGSEKEGEGAGESESVADKDKDYKSQMAALATPQFLFGRGFGRVEHPDEGLVTMTRTAAEEESRDITKSGSGTDSAESTEKMERMEKTDTERTDTPKRALGSLSTDRPPKKARMVRAQVRFAD